MEKKLWFFLLKFFAIFGVLYALLFFAPIKPLEYFLTGVEAKALNLPFDGNKIFVKNGLFEIGESCTGLVSGIILAAIVFSLRKPGFKTKFLLFFAGFSVLFLSNFLRLYIVLWFGSAYGIELAELVHVFTWFATSALIILLWYFLTKKMAKVEKFNELV